MTGAFWFFAAENVEVVVKMFDGCAINGHFWLYVSGLTDLGVDLTVIDRQSGTARTYRREAGRLFAPLADVEAFPCP